MKLSVIVPVYNMAADDKLTWCIDSLIAQTLFSEEKETMEILAVDDASTDNSAKILEGYAERFPKRFRVIHLKENLHQGGAKNAGLRAAQGEWIGFIDADDWVTKDFYETLLACAEETGADLAGCDHSLVTTHTWETGEVVKDNDASQSGVLDKEKYRSLLLQTGHLVVKIFKRRILFANGEENVFPEHIFYEDNAVAARFMLRAKSFAYVERPMYYYYQHGTSTVHTLTKKNLEDRLTAGRALLKGLKEDGALKDYHDEIEYIFTRLFYVNTLFSAMPASTGMEDKWGFTKALAQEMARTFPDFQKNPYYLERTDEEEKKLIAMQMRSQLKFYCYYKLLWAYRRLRYKA